MTKVRLQRYLAQAGVAARRKAEQLIRDGVVRVNGKVVRVMGTKVDPNKDKITVNREAVHPQDLFYLVLNKPKATISAVTDDVGRQTVMEFLPGVPVRVAPVGRLDYHSEGVLLLTNDGELSAALQSPKRHVEKTYHVKIKGTVSARHISILRKGVKLDYRTTTLAAQVDRLRTQSKHDWLVITITEGKNRQIHRMMESLGYEVSKLSRVAFAGITFHGLRVGDARELTQGEVNSLYAAVGIVRSERAASRGKWKVLREDTDISRRARTKARIEEEEAAELEARPSKRVPTRSKPVAKRGVRSKGTTRGKPAPKRGARSKPASRGKRPSPRSGKRPTKPAGGRGSRSRR